MIESAIITIVGLVALMTTSFFTGWYFRRDLKEKPAIKEAFDSGFDAGMDYILGHEDEPKVK